MAESAPPESTTAIAPAIEANTGSISLGAAGRLGPVAVCAAALAVPLVYLPNLDSIFSAPKLALLLVVGALGLGGQALAVAAGAARPRWPRPLAVAVAALIATTALSALAAAARGRPGAPYAGGEILRFCAVAGVAMAAAQATADAQFRRRLFESIHAAAGVVSLIGLLQHVQIIPIVLPTISVPGSTFGNRNIAAEAVAMAIPFGLGLLAGAARPAASRGATPGTETPPALLVTFLALQLVYLGATRTRGAWLGAALGASVFLALLRPAIPRSARLAALALAAGALIAALIPGRLTVHDSNDAKRFAPAAKVVGEVLDPSSPLARTRIGLWRRTLAIYAEHPILGAGPGNFAVVFPRFAEPGAHADGVISQTLVPRRAHEDLLERLAETGPFGLAALLAVYAACGAVALRRTREGRRAATGPAGADAAAAACAAASAAASVAAMIGCGLTGFPLAMPATALLFGVAIGVLAAAGGARVTARVGGGWRARGAVAAAGLLAAGAVAGAATVSARALLGSYWAARAEVALRAPDPQDGATRALAALARAERIDPGRFRVALRASHVALLLDRGAEALREADAALAVEPDSPHAWALRAEALLHNGDAAGAARDAAHATALMADFPDALATLARADGRTGDREGERAAREHLTALAAASADARRSLDQLGSAPAAAPH